MLSEKISNSSTETKKPLNRREFLELMIKGSWSLAVMLTIAKIPGSQSSIDEIFKIELDDQFERLSFEEATALTKRFRVMFLKLKEAGFDYAELSPADIENWVTELAPQFVQEGAISQTLLPDDISFKKFNNAQEHNHIGAYASCLGNSIDLNYRMVNPHSSWYNKGRNIKILIHELTHLLLFQYPYCFWTNNDTMEKTANIVAWEVMASLSNSGNSETIFPLIHNLFWTSFDAAMCIAIREDRLDEFNIFRKTLNESAVEKAQQEKVIRDYDPYDLITTTNTYSVQPLITIIKAIKLRNNRISGLALPSENPDNPGFKKDDFEIDDLAYFLAHAEELVDEAVAKKTASICK